MATILPAVKGQQNFITYYQSSVSFAEIAHLVKLPEEILGDELLDNEMTMQRKLNKSRVNSDLVPYLDKDSSFFSAVTLYMVPHDFTALEEGEGFSFQPIESEDDIGNLKNETSNEYIQKRDEKLKKRDEKIIRALSASEINAEGDFERILTPRGTATALFASMSNQIVPNQHWP